MEGGDDANDILATYMDMEKIDNFGENGNQPVKLNHNQKLRHCFSVDEFSGFSSNNQNDQNIGLPSCEAKKAMPPNKLAELWIVDPKRAKRLTLSFSSLIIILSSCQNNFNICF